MTDATNATEYEHTPTYIGGSWMQLNQTASDGTQTPIGSQTIEIFAMMPESFDDDSTVGIETHFITKVPNDTVLKGEFLAQWMSYPVSEEYEEYDETTGEYTTVTEDFNYGLGCIIQAGMDWAMAMPFEDDQSFYAVAEDTLET